MKQKLNELALGYSLAIISALCMLFLGVFGNMGFYMGAAEMMGQWHMFFDMSTIGIMTGMIEAAIISFISGWLFAYIYNRVA